MPTAERTTEPAGPSGSSDQELAFPPAIRERHPILILPATDNAVRRAMPAADVRIVRAAASPRTGSGRPRQRPHPCRTFLPPAERYWAVGVAGEPQPATPMPDHSPDPPPAPPPSSPPRFQGRVGVVTGAARGMGRSHAVGLAREGCDVVLCDVLEDLPGGTPYPKPSPAELDETVRLVEAEGRRCIGLKADVRDPAQ